VKDARTEPALGKRFVEGKNVPSAAVTTDSNVADWVRAGVIAELQRAGAATAKSGAPSLRVSVDQISTSENVLHRSGYEGRIQISAELAGSNGSCWKNHAEGFAENYGYAGSVENYQETLNHALDRAMIQLMGSAEFKKAVCGCS
jgi:lambda repressor-like predicted transcriptional regulator